MFAARASACRAAAALVLDACDPFCYVFVCPQVLYSKFGFMYTDIKLGEEEFILIREDDVIGEPTPPAAAGFGVG
jgi:hypothetical protein